MATSAFSHSPASDDAATKSKTVIILLGPPGSGKGTLATKISTALAIPHISTGDLFRANVKGQTELGKKVQGYLDAGHLVPDSLVLDMVFDRLKKPDCNNGFLLDGTPRTIAQAEALDAFFKGHSFKEHSFKVDAINLYVSDDEVLNRITLRRTCSQCQKIYHLKNAPPKKEGICDVCQGTLIQRSDDTEEVVKERLQAYYKQTKPLEEYYKNKNELFTIDGSSTPDEVYQRALQIIQRN